MITIDERIRTQLRNSQVNSMSWNGYLKNIISSLLTQYKGVVQCHPTGVLRSQCQARRLYTFQMMTPVPCVDPQSGWRSWVTVHTDTRWFHNTSVCEQVCDCCTPGLHTGLQNQFNFRKSENQIFPKPVLKI